MTYNEEVNELHRSDCPEASGQDLAKGQALALVWAPKMCPRCSPDVTTALSV